MAIIKIIKSYYDDGTQGPQPGLKHLLPLSGFNLMRHKITHKWCLTERASCLCKPVSSATCFLPCHWACCAKHYDLLLYSKQIMMIISQCVYFLHPVDFLYFCILISGPTSVLCFSLATLIFHSPSASFFPHPTLEGSSVFHIFFFYNFYAMSIVSYCQGSVQTNQKLELPTWPFSCCIKRLD